MEDIRPRLEQRIELRLKLLPQLWQVIHLLQLPITQLKEKLEEEFEKNPLLEMEEDKEDRQAIPEEMQVVEEESAWWQRTEKVSPEEEKKRAYLESLVTKPETLQEHLIKQLHLQDMDEQSLAIGEELIGNIDEDGYLKVGINEIAKKFNVNPNKVEEILRVIQRLDPPGVGARDLGECLIAQLKVKGLDDPVFEEIIEKFLPDLASHNYEKIEKSLKISETQMQKFLQILKSLDPKPGRNYSQTTVAYAIPEISLEVDEDGNYILKINEHQIPRVRISQQYVKLLQDPNTPPETKKYIREKMKSAKELISALEQRNQTILKIANFLVEYQRDFFKDGKSALKPLTLRQVAEATGLDESTVSRAVNGKYMETPFGIIELRQLFSSQVKGVSSERIKERIKELIAGEDPKKPLSDQKIAQILKEEGIDVARRTVAKYREELRILPSKLRRR